MRLWIYLFFHFLHVLNSNANLVILNVTGYSHPKNRSYVEVCALYSPEQNLSRLTNSEDDFPIENLYPDLLCEATPVHKGSVVVAKRGNCTFYSKGISTQNAGGLATVVVLEKNVSLTHFSRGPTVKQPNDSFPELKVPVMLMQYSHYNEIKGFVRMKTQFTPYAPSRPSMKLYEPGLSLIFIASVATLCTAAILNGRLFGRARRYQ